MKLCNTTLCVLFSLAMGCGADETDGADGNGDGTEAGGEEAGPGGGPSSADASGSTTGASGDPATTEPDETSGSDETGSETGNEPDPDSEDPFDGLPVGEDQWEYVCSLGWGDPVSTAFCAGDSPPSVTSLAQLQQLLMLDFPSNYGNGVMGNPAYAMIGHSTSIAAREVTPINPRTLIFTPPATTGPVGGGLQPNAEFVVLAFVRGEGFVELISKDPTAGGELRFFLFKFDHSCDVADDCTFGDRYTPTWESSWSEYTLYDGDTIRNTIFDCKQCHQPSGPDAQSMLLMREIVPDWGHWFYPETPGNLAILDAYRAAKGIEESYGGIPSIVQWSPQHNDQSQSMPAQLHGLVDHNGFANQPIAFDVFQIDSERQSGGTSPTWDALYDEAVQGNVPPVPHWDGLVTDPVKLAAATSAYQDFLSGVIGQDALPDLGDIWNDAILDDVSIRPKAGLTGREILVHMCQHCHNSSLDQNISRARFNVEVLDQLSQEVKDEAVYRLMLPDTKAGKMPPARFHELSDAELDLVIAELEG